MKIRKDIKQEVSLWFDERTSAEKIREEVKKHAATLEQLHVCNIRFQNERFFKGLKLPRLKDLIIGGMSTLDSAEGFEFLHGLTALRRLNAGYTRVTDSLLAGLSAAPFWTNLTQLELVLRDLDKAPNWSSLWLEKTLPLEILCLYHLDYRRCQQFLKAKLPRLSYLAVGSSIGDDFLDLISNADLPELQDLELRHSDITPQGLGQFLRQPRPGLPKLERVGIVIYSDRREDWLDWNGAVVGWGYEQMTDSEIEHEYFAGTGLSLLPDNQKLQMRFQSSGGRLDFSERSARPTGRLL